MAPKILTFTVGLMALVALSACQTTSVPTYSPITSEAAFAQAVVGKTLFLDSKVKGTVLISDDKTWKGEVGPMKMTGTWQWVDGYWCRTLVGSDDDCQTYELSSTKDSVRVSRDKGNGKTWIYKILTN